MHSSDVCDELSAIAYAYGHRLAELIADFLEGSRAEAGSGSPAPPPYLLELGAVLQLTVWEANGLRASLPADLISAEAAREQLKQRIRSGIASFNQPESAVLFRDVLYCWLEHCAWAAPDCLGAEIVIANQCAGPNEWLDDLADFLWTNRGVLSELDQEMNGQ